MAYKDVAMTMHGNIANLALNYIDYTFHNKNFSYTMLSLASYAFVPYVILADCTYQVFLLLLHSVWFYCNLA